MMRHLILMSLFILPLLGQAQLRKEKKEQLKALKIAYMTDELQLTPEEATRFWPVFNAFEEKQREIRKQKLKNYLDSEGESSAQLNEKDAQQALKQMAAMDEEVFQAKKKLLEDLKGVIPAYKIIQLKQAEEKFKQKLLRKLQDRRK
ncbi:MAG: sensor of ECF-type sigma factor [Flavobacterium sp. BFFFF2]|nr:MAG: sensor of ECF-type sigma factor [Flavobacterium sp. BFFFF2]